MNIREQHQDGISVYHHPNPHIRSYLLEENLSVLKVEHLKNPLTADTAKNLYKLGLIGSQVAKDILEIAGVYEIRMKPKEVWVKKKEASSWDEAEEKILNIIAIALRRKKFRLVSRSR